MTRDEAAAAIVGRVLVREGGVKDVGDGKGLTRFGQTPAWLETFKLPAPDTPEQAAANYRSWLDQTHLIEVCEAPDDFADVVVDFAVNSGHRQAILDLQRVLGVTADGAWGPETQHAVDNIQNRHELARRVLGRRLRLVGHILAVDVSTMKFAAGWLNRIAEQIEGLT